MLHKITERLLMDWLMKFGQPTSPIKEQLCFGHLSHLRTKRMTLISTSTLLH